MRKITTLLTITFLLTGGLLLGQNGTEEWPELEAVHEIMSMTYHPAEDGDLGPIKERSGDLVESASLLAKSEIPESYDSEEMQEAVKTFLKESKGLDKMIKKGKASDDEIIATIVSVHQVFHQIKGMCDDHEEHSDGH